MQDAAVEHRGNPSAVPPSGWARVAKLVDAEGLNPSVPQGTCGFESRPGHISRLIRPTGRETIRETDAILFDATEVVDSPASVAHELGHMFGLDHAESPSTCGSKLVPARDEMTQIEVEVERRTANLMRTDIEGGFGLPVDSSRSSYLTPEQQRRALEVTCASTEVLGARPVS